MNQFSEWAMHVKRAGWPSGQLALRLGLAAVLIGLVACLYLLEASQMSTVGRHLENMRQEYEQLKRDNADLLYQIAQEGSIVRLQQRSAEKGLIPAPKVEYLWITTQYASQAQAGGADANFESPAQP
jgi:hypothetical protein